MMLETLGMQAKQAERELLKLNATQKNECLHAVAEGLISGMTPTTLAPQNTAYRVECAAIFERFMKNIMKVK